MPLDAVPLAIRDQLARTTALTALDRTLLVEAGAGSGKTSVLAGRVVMLLASGRAPGDIAAISFTEFSASELRERIVGFVDALLTETMPLDLLPAFPGGKPSEEQLARLAEARAALDSLCCLTIHGFCRTLLTPYPVEARIDPGAAMLDQADTDLLFEDVYMSWLRERLSGDDKPGDLFATLYLADQKATDALLRDLTEKLLEHRSAGVARRDPVGAEMQALLDAAAAFRGFLVAECPGNCSPDAALFADQLEATLAGAPPAAASEALTLPWMIRLAVPECCAIEKGTAFGKNLSSKKAWLAACGGGKAMQAEAERLHGRAQELYEACRGAHTALRAAAAGRLLHLLASEARTIIASYSEAKQKAAVLDFGDLLEKARLLLAGNDEVRRALGQRHPVVLVDEFQDTDPEQLEIFWRLCSDPPAGNPGAEWTQWVPRPGALFLVGDPKQAIYRFRGADLAAYLQARNLMRDHDKDCVLPIFRNFRSRAEILNWVNEQFEACFSVEGQAEFARLETDVADTLGFPAVSALPFDLEGLKADGIRDLEADRVAELCSLVVGNVQVRDRKGGLRPCKASDIALLAPAGTDLWRYERALEEKGLSVATQAGKGFFRRQEIQDLIALTRTLADHRDRLALGALLRGPLVGLTDQQLLDAVAEQTEPGQDPPQLSVDLGSGPNLEKISNPLLKEILGKLNSLAKKRRSVTPHIMLCEAVEYLNVRSILRQRGDRVAERALANLDLFLEMARPYDVRGLRAFSDAMRTQWEEARKAQDGRPDAGEFSISLVTMHSAKGLEWGVVIPVNTAGKAMDMVRVAYDRTANILHMAAFGCQPEGCRDALARERQEQRFERQRLWYVAATRARDLLLMPRFDNGKLTSESWCRLVSFRLDDLPEFVSAERAANIQTSEDTENRQDRATFLREADIIMAALPRIRRDTPHLAEGAEAPDAMLLVSEDLEGRELLPVKGGLERGLILHKLLEEVLTGEIAETPEALAARGMELSDQLGLKDEKRPVPEELARAVRRGLGRPEIAAIRTKLRPEWPVASTTMVDSEEVATLGVADAAAVEEDGKTSSVVDWKSDVEPSEGAIAEYCGQLGKYLRATGAPEGFLVFLTSGDVRRVSNPG
ncbi:UvrD-helicase domain-containing protein [Siccirubricoccus sp. KC 17139]|uniref:DNA 3'-5' helicase n=1 Tax=Siccirubricoccus soli TaxID=2899147 RepID=A0ABT1D1Q6_9PROT|nr:UvrD-helicase domain-containing protein [Siccirubricoccus soli]MCO6415853.1 UvrD-helicase domain-containing protein [Siccirubricoccus soli]MCP2681985.1 UvrD-helicase domain-containing protein [Siccirubricoccus soli]